MATRPSGKRSRPGPRSALAGVGGFGLGTWTPAGKNEALTRRTYLKTVPLLLALAVLAAGCGSKLGATPPSRPPEGPVAVRQVKHAVVAFLTASPQVACARLTDNGRRQVTELRRLLSAEGGRPLSCEALGGPSPLGRDGRRKVRRPEVKAWVRGTTAMASVFERSRSGRSRPVVSDLRLRYLDGKWRVEDLGREYREVLGAVREVAAQNNTAARLDCRSFRLLPGAWQRTDTESSELPTERQRLADAIVKCQALANRTKQEVLRLLGRPDNYVGRHGEASWRTGTERSFFGLDDEHLLVSFDRSQRVRSVRLATD